MPIYDDMHARYLAWNALLTESEISATAGMINFREAFQKYLGAPDEIVTLCAIEPNADGLQRYRSVDHFAKALSQDDEGNWRFGLGVIFGFGQTFLQIFIDMRMRLEANGFVFSNALDKASPKLSCKFDDETATLNSFFVYLSELINGQFDRKPWQGLERTPIGFFPPRTPRLSSE